MILICSDMQMISTLCEQAGMDGVNVATRHYMLVRNSAIFWIKARCP
jgi:hypothetical protein